jgi:hypothetical protein
MKNVVNIKFYYLNTRGGIPVGSIKALFSNVPVF